MKKHKKIVSALAVASSVLIGSGNVYAESPAALDKSDLFGWDASTSVLYYTEPDRVSALEAILNGKYQLESGDFFNLRLTVDSLTGASASGAVASDEPLTYTRPSGNDSYLVQANETPLDDTFLDTRVAVNALWSKGLSPDLNMKLGANVSTEYDYLSIGANSTFSYDLNNKNTTISAGVSVASDTIDPEGGIPTSFGIMTNAGEPAPRSGTDDTKTTVDILLGVTQIIDSRSLVVFNYSLSQSDGYHTDPFKIISVVDESGRPIERDAATNLAFALFENRPDSRMRNSFFTQYRRNVFSEDVFDISYRFMADDWGINSHTIDARYKLRINGQNYLRPHFRIYQQSEADFYTPFFLNGTQPVAGDSASEASADYRLADFTALTLGLEYGQDNIRFPWSLAFEYYLQTGDEPSGKFGELDNQELMPDVDAILIRFNFDI